RTRWPPRSTHNIWSRPRGRCPQCARLCTALCRLACCRRTFALACLAMSARIPRPASFDPIGRLRFPRRTTTLRAVVVAVLLVTAAGVLHSGGSAGDRPGAAGTPPTAPAGTPGATGTPVPVAGVLGTVPAGGPLSQLPEEWTAQERVPVPDGTVGVPLALPEPGALAMLRPGDR